MVTNESSNKAIITPAKKGVAAPNTEETPPINNTTPGKDKPKRKEEVETGSPPGVKPPLEVEKEDYEEFPEELKEMAQKHANALLSTKDSFDIACEEWPGRFDFSDDVSSDIMSPPRGRSLVESMENPDTSWDRTRDSGVNDKSFATARGSMGDDNTTPLRYRRGTSNSPRRLRSTPARMARSPSNPEFTQRQKMDAGHSVTFKLSKIRHSPRIKAKANKKKREEEYLSSDYEN